MEIVGIFRLNEQKEEKAGELAAALGVTKYEALSRLRVPGSGPVIVGVFADGERSSELAKRLRDSGFHALTLSADEIKNVAGGVLVPRRFAFGKEGLQAENSRGEKMLLPYSRVDVLIRGTSVSRTTDVETTKESSFSLGRAVLSGGLVMKKTTKTTREITTEEREGFLNVYVPNEPVVSLRENSLSYDALGPALNPSRNANFACVVRKMRELCPAAIYDDRLLNKAAQAALLSPRLDSERHLEIAAALIAKALRQNL